MKSYLTTALALVCLVLVAALVVVKRGDNARHDTDASTIADYSNRLDSAQTRIAIGEGKILGLTNSLDEARSASLTFSNQLVEAQASITLGAEQVAGLVRQVAAAEAEKETLNQRLVDLNTQMTNQIDGLTKQIAVTQASLDEANKNSALLANRLRRDVAERVVLERKFNNLSEVQAQVQKLEKNPADAITPESIYAGLNVEVKSNGTFHVISPD